MGNFKSQIPDRQPLTPNPHVIVITFPGVLSLSEADCHRIHAHLNSTVQSRSACLLFATDVQCNIYNTHGVKIHKFPFGPEDLPFMKEIAIPNSIAVECIRGMSWKDILNMRVVLEKEFPGFRFGPIIGWERIVTRYKTPLKVWFCSAYDFRKLLQEPQLPLVEAEKPVIIKSECPVCLEIPKGYVALSPCGHAIYCQTCASSLTECAICREKIESILKIFQ